MQCLCTNLSWVVNIYAWALNHFQKSLQNIWNGSYHYMRCGYKIIRLIHFLIITSYNWNIVIFSVLSSSIPTQLHTNFPLLEVMLQVFLIASSWPVLLLPSLYQWTQNNSLTQTWPLETKRKHMGHDQVSIVHTPEWKFHTLPKILVGSALCAGASS